MSSTTLTVKRRALIIDTDNCYITDDFDGLKYLGPIIFESGWFRFWNNNQYEEYWNNFDGSRYMGSIVCVKDKLILVNNNEYVEYWNKHLEFKKKYKIHMMDHNNIDESMPPNTEILLVKIAHTYKLKNLPVELKIICFLSNNPNILKINLPIELKYLCICKYFNTNKKIKAKIPFGCKIIEF